MLAPPIVHQIWMQGWEKRPHKFEDNIQRLRTMNPEFEFKTWDEEQIAAECEDLGPEFLEKYRSFSHMISRVDYGRYVLLYKYGGISLDLDMKPLHPLRDTPGLAKYDFIVSGSAYPYNKLGLVNNAVLIVKRRHPLLQEFLHKITDKNVSESDYITRDIYIHNTTGPLILNEFIQSHKQAVHVLDNQYFEPCMSVDPYCRVPETAIMDHQHELSWMSASVKQLATWVFYFLYNWSIFVFVIIVLMGICMPYTRVAKGISFSRILGHKYLLHWNRIS